MALSRQVGHKRGIALALTYLGNLVHELGDRGQARSLHEEGLAIRRELRDQASIAYSLLLLGAEARLVEDYERARSLCEESLVIGRELGDRPVIARSLIELARVAETQREPERAARLFGAAAALCEALHLHPPTDPWGDGAARTALGEEAFAAAWAEGRALSLDDAVALALDETRPG